MKTAAQFFDKPITGKWPGGDKLPMTAKVRGRDFVRSLGLPKHDAVAQYREDTPTNSRHLYVLPNGKYIIDHLDEHSPHSSPLKHFQHDVIAKKEASMLPEVLSAFGDEMRKQSLLGTLLAMPVRSALTTSALEKQKETARLKALRKLLTKGDETEVVVQSKGDHRGPHYDKENGKQFISVRKEEDPGIIAHELGHAELDRETIGSILQSKVMRAVPVVGGIAGMTIARGGGRNMAIGAAISAASWAPVLAYEGMASLRGIERLRRVGAREDELADAKSRLLKAWGTYATLPAEAAANAVFIAHL